MPFLRNFAPVSAGLHILKRFGRTRLTFLALVLLVIMAGCWRGSERGVPAPPEESAPAAETASPAVDWAKQPKKSGPNPHPGQYLLTHAAEARLDQSECADCHEKASCDTCHSLHKTHGLNWLSKHGEASKAIDAKCASCHPLPSCEVCHTQGLPASHNGRFITEHGKGTEFGQCRQCHTQQSCRTCHQDREPGSHKTANWKRAHGREAKAGAGRCLGCHRESTCIRCHDGMQMPHPAGWERSHAGTRASRSMSNCDLCHQKQECASCHKRTEPASHKRNWLQGHGRASRQGNCSLCHSRSQCASCHKTSKPPSHRAAGFMKQHGRGAREQSCALCHGQKACQTCHQGQTMPHSDDFLMGGHGRAAAASPRACAACHKQEKACLSCHEGAPPANHAADSFNKKHGSGSKELCALCHGKQSCTTCHSSLTKSPHSDDFAMEHKSVAKFERDASCFLCHKLDDCQSCHGDVKLSP